MPTREEKTHTQEKNDGQHPAESLEPQRRKLFDDLVAAAHQSEADDATAEASNAALHAAVRARDAAIAACPKYSQHDLWLATVKNVPMKSDNGAFAAVRRCEAELEQARLTARAANDALRASRTRMATTLSAWTVGQPVLTPEAQGAAFRAQSQADRAFRIAHGIPQRRIGYGQGRRQGTYSASARNPITVGPAVPQQLATRMNAERARALTIAETNAAHARRKLPSEL